MNPIDFSADFPVTGNPRKEEAEMQRRKSRVIVVFAHQIGLVVVCEPGDPLAYLEEMGAGATPFELTASGVDHCQTMAAGAYYGTLILIDDGPGDFPGTREVCASLTDLRPVTAEEWTATVAGDWPW